MEKARVLIIDDRHENISALTNLIEADDVDIFSASNAEEALGHLLDHDFALALLDVQMPGIDGFELARIIRGVKRHKNLPIIFLTALKEEEATIHAGYGSGAVDVLFKPLDAQVVRSKVRIFIQMAKQSAQLKDQMRELEELRERADEANLAKGRFLANMSHEIRTPLGAVMGFADILASNIDVKSADRIKFSEAIRRNGQLLLKLIDDVLDLSRIEAGKVELEKAEFALDELLRDVNTTMSLRAKEKSLSLLSKNNAGKWHLLGDFARIKQILLNLLGNAVKFTERGSVELAISVTEDQKIEFRVTDTGLGLNEEEAKRLFQRFSQADASTKKRFGGSGLGLMISKQLAQEMGGDLTLEKSEPGVGSTFVFWMPLVDVNGTKQSTDANEEDAKSDFLKGKSILFVDDSRDNQELVKYMFRNSGAEMTFASSGRECLEQMKTQHFDCCLMDVQMPEMDGIDTTRNARLQGYSGPILAVTAYAGQTERQRCLDAGCEAVVTKPIDSERLFNQLEAVLTR